MDIEIYKCTADTRQLDKSSYLTLNKKVSVHMKEGTDVLNPTFKVARGGYSLSGMNYMYVDTFKRYYFITNIRLTEGGIIEIDGHVDVLMTYKSNIIGKKALIERQEYKYSPYIVDNELKVRTGRYVKNFNIGSFSAPSGAYFVLNVNGGGS